MAYSTARGPTEYVIRVPKIPPTQKYAVLKFNNNPEVDVMQWQNLTVEREDNSDKFEEKTEVPSFGEGSEYNKANREMSRRKRHGYIHKEYDPNQQPWLLTIHDSKRGDKKLKGIREGGAGQSADYWVLAKSAEGVFDALPVSEWYNFMPVGRYKTLDIDEAEEKFKDRDKMINLFALKMGGQIAATAETEVDDKTALRERLKSELKLTDQDEQEGDAMEAGSEDETEEETEETAKPEKQSKKPVNDSQEAKKKASRKRSSRKETEDDDEEIASEDSDDGDVEGREVDYMSDSEESNSEPDEEKRAQQVDEKGVADESGLRKILTDQEDEDDEESKNEEEAEDEDDVEVDEEGRAKSMKKEDESNEESDSDDPDQKKSALFMSRKQALSSSSQQQQIAGKAAAGGNIPFSEQKSASGAEKRPASKDEGKSAVGGSTSVVPPEKKPRMEEPFAGITETEVRKYLLRKPHTTKELVAKFKKRCAGGMSKDEIVRRLADVLKTLKPNQRKVNGVLQFSLLPVVGVTAGQQTLQQAAVAAARRTGGDKKEKK